MPHEIGFAVQPRTYLTSRRGVIANLGTAFRGSAELVQRAMAARGTQQGFIGTLSSAYAGHTLLHSRTTPTGGQTSRLSTGFSPDGVVNSARIGVGTGRSVQLAGALAGSVGGALTSALFGDWRTGAATGAAIGAVALPDFGSRNVPGAFHNETGIERDPRSLGAMRSVGPGMHANFTAMQNRLISDQRGTYSFQPDLRRSQNCGTSAISQMRGFVDHAKGHLSVMGELQSVMRRTGPGAGATGMLGAIAPNRGNRIYSANQQQ